MGVFDPAIDYYGTKKTMEYDNYQVDKKFEQDLHMWNLNNAYNDPSAQMQRFKQAGLNPNLVYQQGNPGNSKGPIQKQTPPSPNIGKGLLGMDTLGQFMNLAQQKVQIDYGQEQVKAQQIENINNSIKEGILGTKAKRDALKFDIDFAGKEASIGSINQGYLNKQLLGNNLTMDYEKKAVEKSILDKKLVQEGMKAELGNLNMTALDPIWLRVLMKALDKSPYVDLGGTQKNLKNPLNTKK